MGLCLLKTSTHREKIEVTRHDSTCDLSPVPVGRAHRPTRALFTVIPGECLNLRLLRVFSVHPCQDPADNLERYPAVTCSQAIVDLAELRKQQFDRARVARDGFVDQLFDQRLALGDSPSLAVLTDDDRLLEHLLHQCREILRTLGRPLGFPDCPLQKRVRRGGLPNPTAYSGLSSSAILHLCLGFELFDFLDRMSHGPALPGTPLRYAHPAN